MRATVWLGALVTMMVVASSIGIGIVATSDDEPAPSVSAPPTPTPTVTSSRAKPDRFVRTPVPLRDFNLRDLGVTDVDGDGALDLFTTNHSAPESVLLGDGKGGFTEVRDRFGLGADPSYAEVLPGRKPPRIPGRGVLIYWRGHDMFLVVKGATSSQPVTVSLVAYSAVRVKTARGVSVQNDRVSLGRDVERSDVTVTATRTGRARLVVVRSAVPVDVAANVAPGMGIFVGARAAPSSSSTLRLWIGRDRHGISWVDMFGGPRPEAVVVRGGLRGAVARYPIAFHEEVQSWDGSGYQDLGEQLGLAQRGCSGFDVRTPDINGDGRLDVHIACSRGRPDLIYLWSPQGFVESHRQLGLDLAGARPTVWYDFDGDGDQDLVRAEVGRVQLYRNTASGFRPRTLFTRSRGHIPSRIRTADVDRDGDLDLWISARQGKSVLLLREGTRLTAVPRRTTGLPSEVLAASWVDVDNDGWLDLYAIPGGLYRQVSPLRFEPLPLIADRASVVQARASWFDADGDGRRDLIRATISSSPAAPKAWESDLLLNRMKSGHWFQLDLFGPRLNRSAVGASAIAFVDGHRTALRVGDADGSAHSQGHYRMYIGLGESAQIDRLIVTWPDGRTTELRDLRGDRRMVLRYDAA